MRKKLQKTAKIQVFVQAKRQKIMHYAQWKGGGVSILVQNAEKVLAAQINVASGHTKSEISTKNKGEKETRRRHCEKNEPEDF